MDVILIEKGKNLKLMLSMVCFLSSVFLISLRSQKIINRTPNEELLPVADPLAWFGALVSPNLRQSQQDFAAGKL
jgi:hypothetical protein